MAAMSTVEPRNLLGVATLAATQPTAYRAASLSVRDALVVTG